MEAIAERVKSVIAGYFGPGTAHHLKADTKLVDDLGADSLDLVELTMELEDEFDIEISDEDAAGLYTVQQAIDYITSRVPA